MLHKLVPLDENNVLDATSYLQLPLSTDLEAKAFSRSSNALLVGTKSSFCLMFTPRLRISRFSHSSIPACHLTAMPAK